MLKFIKTIIFLILISILLILAINTHIILSTKGQIIEEDNYKNLKDIDCILVLGASVWGSIPSPMLEDRIIQSINLYNNQVSPKILMSGDHTTPTYDEVNIMKNYATNKGIPSTDIFMDHAGIATYDSIYRTKEIFMADKIVIVTQKYHLYRALHIANQLGIEAYGVPTTPKQYRGMYKRELREILARTKDYIKSIIKPESTYLGETIPVSGDGNITNDK